MTQSPDNNPPAARKSDRTVKIIFLIVALVIAAVVVMFIQPKDEILAKWPKDLDAALADANQTGRRVLAIFVSNPPNADSVFVATKTLAKTQNVHAIEAGKFARVKVVVNDPSGDQARKYKLTVLPTIVIFDSKGREVARTEGNVGEVPFMEFIDAANKKQ